MKIKITLIPILAATLFSLSCFTSYVHANPPKETPENGWDTDEIFDKEITDKGAVECDVKEAGSNPSTYYHKPQQDTNNIITDTTDKTTLNKDEMTGDELKSAIKNWIESLWTETPDVDVQGYEDGNITRVLKSHMNIIPYKEPYKELIGQQWVPCDPDDIGAVRF